MKLEDMLGSISFLAKLPLDQLAGALVDQADQEELLRFIITIDDAIADWDFTTKLHKHFAAEVKIFKQELADEEKGNESQ